MSNGYGPVLRAISNERLLKARDLAFHVEDEAASGLNCENGVVQTWVKRRLWCLMQKASRDAKEPPTIPIMRIFPGRKLGLTYEPFDPDKGSKSQYFSAPCTGAALEC